MNNRSGKLRKMIIYSLLVLTAFVGALIIIEQFFYSLTGFAMQQTNLCRHKTVCVRGENSAPQPLSFPIDPHFLAAEMRKVPGYEVNDRNGVSVMISRRFGEVKYNIVLGNRDGYGLMNLNTFDSAGYSAGSVVGGETCTTPGRFLKKNVYNMIDDLPITTGQKDEMKGYVAVTVQINFSLF